MQKPSDNYNNVGTGADGQPNTMLNMGNYNSFGFKFARAEYEKLQLDTAMLNGAEALQLHLYEEVYKGQDQLGRETVSNMFAIRTFIEFSRPLKSLKHYESD